MEAVLPCWLLGLVWRHRPCGPLAPGGHHECAPLPGSWKPASLFQPRVGLKPGTHSLPLGVRNMSLYSGLGAWWALPCRAHGLLGARGDQGCVWVLALPNPIAPSPGAGDAGAELPLDLRAPRLLESLPKTRPATRAQRGWTMSWAGGHGPCQSEGCWKARLCSHLPWQRTVPFSLAFFFSRNDGRGTWCGSPQGAGGMQACGRELRDTGCAASVWPGGFLN